MADKQPQLNGAYYGPAIPPAEAPPHRRQRNCSCCCIFSFFWKLLLAVAVLLLLAFIVFYAVVQPRAFRLYVTNATLTQFSYTSNDSTLRYNLVLNFTARNPNKKLGFYYESVEGDVSYDGVRFASREVLTVHDSFRQSTKRTNGLNGVFTGYEVTKLDEEQVKGFEEDERNRAFDIEVRLHFRIRFVLGELTTSSTKAKAKCELEVPLSSKENAPMAPVFVPTDCHVHF